MGARVYLGGVILLAVMLAQGRTEGTAVRKAMALFGGGPSDGEAVDRRLPVAVPGAVGRTTPSHSHRPRPRSPRSVPP